MPRPTSANRCALQVQAVIAARPVVVECTRGQGHAGTHQGKIQWAPRIAAPPPPGRKP